MRFIVAVFLAIAVAVGLFWLMQYLILGRDRVPVSQESFRTVDFVRLQPQEELQTRQRSKPEPPPPEEPPPPPPALAVQQSQQTARNAPTPMEMPKLSVPTNLSGGPFLGAMGAGPGAADAELIPLVRLSPQYPRQAARARISGWVKLRIVVNPDGSVRDARAVDAQPRGLFEAAAVTAAMRGRFRPRMVGGQAVESTGEYTVTFQLAD